MNATTPDTMTQEPIVSQYPSNPIHLGEIPVQKKQFLCIDIGNSMIKIGFFNAEGNWKVYAYDSHLSKESANWLKVFETLSTKYGLNKESLKSIHVTSVKPEINSILTEACQKYFKKDVTFLNASNCPNLKIKIQNPNQLGPDFIASSLAALRYYPSQNIIIASFGTATCASAITKNAEFLGACIMPGVKICFESLTQNTSLLPKEIASKPTVYLGKNTAEAMQSGVYYLQLGGIEKNISNIKAQVLDDNQPIVLSAGGYALMFKDDLKVDAIIPDLPLQGLLWMNDE